MAIALSRRQAVDWAVLERVCSGDEGLLLRLLDAFLVDGEKDDADLACAVAAGDMPEVSRVAHRIYGAARTVGAVELAEISHALDVAGLAGHVGRVAELGPQVRERYAAVTALIRERQGAARGGD